MTSLSSVNSSPLHHKTVLVRTDLNLPLHQGTLLEDSRLHALTKTIQYLKAAQAKIVLISHFGRPKIADKSNDQSLDTKNSLRNILPFLQKHFPDLSIAFSTSLDPSPIQEQLRTHDCVLLENIRFHREETSKDIDVRRAFAQQLSNLGDIYVNEAFSVSHRTQASVTELPLCMTSYLGFSHEEEISSITRILDQNTTQHCVAVLGGSKVSSKIEFIERLLSLCSKVLLGGGLANTFLAAQNIDVRDSLNEPDLIPRAKDILAQAQQQGVEILIPIDVHGQSSTHQAEVYTLTEPLPDAFSILDIGPKTAELYLEHLKTAEVILWNGPLGLFETPPFNQGSLQVAQVFKHSTATSLIGGGETLALMKQAQVEDNITFRSRGGGAFLDFIAKGSLPGSTAILNQAS